MSVRSEPYFENGPVPEKEPATEPPRPTRKKRRVWLRFLVWMFLFFFLLGCGLVWGVYQHFSKGLPTLNGLTDYHPSLVTRVYARNYQLLGEFYHQRRQFVPMSEVPRPLVEAFLATEDSKFYQHPGIDPEGIARAFVANVKAGRVVQGASTITQQVARTFLLSSIKKFSRKIKEIILALRIEQRFTKDEILELYVNQIYLGAGAYGVGAASRIYFNRDVSELTLGQMAMLAALPKAPSNYSPWRFPKRADKRRKLVLNRMAKVGFITAAEARAAAEAPLGLAHPPEPLERVAPHYLEHVRRTLQEEWGQKQLLGGGLDVYTTLEPRLQRVAQAAVRRGLIEYDRRHGYRGPLARLQRVDGNAQKAWLASVKEKKPTVAGYLTGLVLHIPKKGPAIILLMNGRRIELTLEGVLWARERLKDRKRRSWKKINHLSQVLNIGDVILVEPPSGRLPPKRRRKIEKKNPRLYYLAQEPDAESALVSLDPHTGQILAMVGGYDFEKSEFNRATQSRRQPGSAFKPFLYASALDSGLSPVDRIDDSPVPMIYFDAVTGEKKIWRPKNYEKKFYGPTTLRNGLEHSRNLVSIRLLKRVGIGKAVEFMQRFGFHIPRNRYDFSLALGSVSFTPLQVTAGFGVFANGGKLLEPVYIARVQDRYGRTVHRHGGGDCLLCHVEPERRTKKGQPQPPPLFGRRVLDPTTAYQVTSLMKGVIARGTGTKAQVLRRPLAGKTGTTNDLRDAWFVGFSPSLVAGVWMGMDDSSILGYRETGATAALPIWIDYMEMALKGRPKTDFPVPSGIHLEAIDAETGEPVGDRTKFKVFEAFKEGQNPQSPKMESLPDTIMDLESGVY